MVDKLHYDSNLDSFYFNSKNPNISKIHNIVRSSINGARVWSFHGGWPSGYVSLKDAKAIIPTMKATDEAIARIEHLKSVPDQLENLSLVNKLDYNFKLKPFVHQLRALEYLLHFPILALLAEQGLGKTYMAGSYLDIRKQERGQYPALVLCPRIVVPNWYYELTDYTDLRPIVYQGDIKQRRKIKEQLQCNNQQDWDVVITTYDLLCPEKARTRFNSIPKKDIRPGSEVIVGDETTWLIILDMRGSKRSVEYKTASKHDWVPYKDITKARNVDKIENWHLEDTNLFQRELNFDAIVMDEGSRLKGYTSNRSQVVQNITQRIKNRVLLSGTISLGNPLDVYMPFNILDPKIFGTNYWKFRNKYCRFSPYNKHVLIGYKNLDVLKYRIDPYILSIKRDDCLDLERTKGYTYYDISEEQYDAYNTLIAEGELHLGRNAYVRADLTMTKINKLVQILSGFLILTKDRSNEYCGSCAKILECVDDSIYPWSELCTEQENIPKPGREYYEFKTNPKLETLSADLDLLDEKVILWTMYQKETEQIIELLKKKKISYITANDKESDRRYDADPSIQVYLGQISQGIGTTMISAAQMWFYNRSLKLDDYLQAIDRNYRIGQKKHVYVKDFVHPGSVEENIITLLREKKDVKDFIQEQVQCKACEKHIWCFERAIIPYSTKCKLYEKRKRVEKRSTIKVKNI